MIVNVIVSLVVTVIAMCFILVYRQNFEKLESTQKLLGFLSNVNDSMDTQCNVDTDKLLKTEYKKIPGATCDEKSRYLCENDISNRGFRHNNENTDNIPTVLSLKCFDSNLRHCNFQ
jgi:hypothetical protein